jgi:leucyl aminopeptidase
LAVNRASTVPPQFCILEWKPEGARNAKPIVLVGKGVVYDTGGLSLKPTEGMTYMKCDMAGAAAVVGTLAVAAKTGLPLHLIGLIPATDNKIGENALSPGDVITMGSGTTVEVVNTDAEGRLILADALHFAQKYDPELVVDLATLTGSAVKALGTQVICYMGTASEKIKKQLESSGFDTYERLVELPLWKEFGDELKSNIADLKNLGSSNAGMITAGKFLEHFTKFPWLHLDIAGPAYLRAANGYRTKEGTGVGVRLLFDFLKKL